MDEQPEEEEEEIEVTPKKGACRRAHALAGVRADPLTGAPSSTRHALRPTLQPEFWPRAGKAKGKSKGKKAAEAPESSSRARWTEEEETALSKYHDRLTKSLGKKEVPDWDHIVRKMIVRRERARAARERESDRDGPRCRSRRARSPRRRPRLAPRRAQDDGFPERSVVAARAHFYKM